MKYLGYHKKDTLPIKQKQRVLIPKGVAVRTTHSRGNYVTARKQWVVVNHILSGTELNGQPHTNPQVVWAGTSGYWCEVDINDILDKQP